MKHEEIDVFDCLYEIPSYKEGSPRISMVKYTDGGMFRSLHMDITVDELDVYGGMKNQPSFSSLHDLKIDSKHYWNASKAWRKYEEKFDIVSHKMQDFSYGLWAHKPCKEIEWQGDAKVGDTFMAMSGELYIAKITDKVGKRWEYIRSRREQNGEEEKEPPFGAIKLSADKCMEDAHLYRSLLIHPIDEEIWNEAYDAYLEWKNSWNSIIAEIRNEYNLPEYVDKYVDLKPKKQ